MRTQPTARQNGGSIGNNGIVITDNLGLVHSVVKKFTTAPPHSYLYQELYSEGVIGLTEAAQRYKPGKARFATYAYFRIKGAILDYMQANKSLIKIPWTANRSEQQLSVISLSASDNDDCSDFKQTDICIEEDGYSFVDLKESIKSVLTEQEYRVLMMKYEGYTQVEISRELNLSQSRISDIIASIKRAVQPILDDANIYI